MAGREPIVRRGFLGWGNRKGGCEAYGPGGRWSKLADGTPVASPNGQEGWGDLLGDDLEREGVSEGADLIVVAVPRMAGGTYDAMSAITTRLHAAVLDAVDEVMADYREAQ